MPATVLSFLLIAGMLGGGCSDPPAPPTHGMLIVGIRLVVPEDTPPLAIRPHDLDGLTSLETTITRVDVVHRTTADDPRTERVITVDNHTQALDVAPDLHDRHTRLLAFLNVPQGFVTQIRFIVRNAAITLHGEQLPSADGGCSKNVIDNVGDSKFEPYITDTQNELAKIKTTWPAAYGPGKSLVVFSGVNCGVQNDPNDDFFDMFAEGRPTEGNPPPDLVAISVSGVRPFRNPPNDIGFAMFARGTHGDAYDLAAPAQDVLTDGTFFAYDDHVQSVAGLSAAAAMVSGALGLMVAKDLSLNGEAQLLKDRLLCNSPSVGLAHLSVANRVLDAFEAVTNANGCP